ncbi:MAG: class I SAM-dependent methyltransferase [Vicinamibacterales bacterium]
MDDPSRTDDSGKDARRAQKMADRAAARAQAASERTRQRLEAKLALRAEEEARRAAGYGYYLSGAEKKIDVRTLRPFGELAARVIAEEQSTMDVDRFYTLWQAVGLAPRGFPFVEVGAHKGASARFIALAMEEHHHAQPFYVCDTFAGHPRADPILDPVHYGSEKFTDTSPAAVSAYLSPHANVRLVVGDFIETSASLPAEARFGLVHVDVDVHPATAFCLDFFSSRLAPGGWIVVDDYGFLTCPGARRAVDDFVATHPAFRMLHLLTGQCLLVRPS